MAGYPGTIAATWQRAGRAGRRTTRSAAVMVASSAPIDQFIVRNPSYFFDASPEHALINPDNLHILLDHVKCAAFELPFTDDEGFGGENVQEVLAVLGEKRGSSITPTGSGTGPTNPIPADAVSLRSISSDNFVVVDTTDGERVIGETDFTSGPSTLHEKAIYIVEGTTVSGRAPRFRRPQGVRSRGGLRLLHRCDHLYEGDDSRYVRNAMVWLKPDTAASGFARPMPGGRTAKSTSSRASSASRKSSSTPTRTWVRVNSICPSSRCTRRRYWLTIPSSYAGAAVIGGDDRRDGVIGLAFAMKNIAQLLLMCDRPRHRAVG